MNRNKMFNFLILILFFTCFVELFYKLGEVPNGLHVDEAGSLYDALSISDYGVDRFLYKNPVYFINYGGGQSVMYTYLTVIFMKIFGVSLYSFRSVAVVFSLISYYLFYKLVKKYDSKIKSVFVLFLLTILPFYVMKSRWGLDCYLLNPFFIISLYFFINAIEKNSNLYYFISGILFGITLYTYVISYLILPLFLVTTLIYLLINEKIKFKNIVCLMLPIITFAIPLILFLFVNKINGEIITNFISIPKLWEYRSSEISFVNMKFFLYNLAIVLCGDTIEYNTINNYGIIYPISAVFVIVYLFILINKIYNGKSTLLDNIMIILFGSIFIISLLVDDVNVNKLNLIYIPLVYFIASFLDWLYNNKYKLLLCFILIWYCCYYFSFINVYFTEFEPDYLFVKDDYFNTLKYVDTIYKDGDYSNICICTNNQQEYIYNLLINKINPYDFNDNLIRNGNKISGYKHYVYECNELNNTNIYMVSDKNKLIEVAKDNNYNIKNMGNYYILYKE